MSVGGCQVESRCPQVVSANPLTLLRCPQPVTKNPSDSRCLHDRLSFGVSAGSDYEIFILRIIPTNGKNYFG